MNKKNLMQNSLLFFMLITVYACSKGSSLNRELVSREAVAKINWFEGPSYRYFLNPYYDFATIRISHDKARFAIVLKRGANECMVINMKEVKCYYLARKFIFSPDSKHFAYAVYCNYGKFAVVFDEKEGKCYDNINGIVFSPDSKHIAYIACKFNMDTLQIKNYMVLDNDRGTPYDGILYEYNDEAGIFCDSSCAFHYLARVANKIYHNAEKRK